MIDNWRALDRIERAERDVPHCPCGAPTVPVARAGGIYLECSSLANPPDGRLRQFLSALGAPAHTRRLVVDCEAEAA